MIHPKIGQLCGLADFKEFGLASNKHIHMEVSSKEGERETNPAVEKQHFH